MPALYETTLYGLFHEEVYASLNGYTMRREHGAPGWVGRGRIGPWVLRDPNGDYVDHDDFRTRLCLTHGFYLPGDK